MDSQILAEPSADDILEESRQSKIWPINDYHRGYEQYHYLAGNTFEDSIYADLTDPSELPGPDEDDEPMPADLP